jgi:hypothetical protein
MDQDNVNLYFLSSYSKNHLNKDYYIFKKKWEELQWNSRIKLTTSSS